MRIAAEQNGVAAEQLEQAMAKLQARIGQATTGNAAAEKGFKDLGLSVRDLAALPADQQLGRVADAINRLDSPSQRAAASVGVLGEEGVKLGNVMRLGLSLIHI